MYAALVLLALTLLVNVIGELIIRRDGKSRTSRPAKGVVK